jgi:hypothetical protein
LLINNLLSAHTFTGRIINEGSQPVEFVNVTLLALPDSTLVGGTTSAENGDFSLTANKLAKIYLLRISMLGYETLTKTIESSVQNLGDIIIKTNAVQLQEISVAVQLPKIRFEKGAYIADIQNSMVAKGNTVESLLNQLPSVWASSNGISIGGKGGVTVYINDRQVNMQGEALMKYLQSLRSEDIAKIEIMPNPTAEFSAEGGGGVIRIITKRIITEGFNGTVSTTTMYKNHFGVAPYWSLQYNKGKFSGWLGFSGEKSKWLSYLEENSQDFVTGTNYNTCGTDTIFDKNYSTALTLNYDFNRFNKLIFYASYMYWGKDEHLEKTTNLSGRLSEDITLTENNQRSEQDMYSYSFSVNYDLLLDSLGKNKFTILADYVNQYKYDVKDFFNYVNKDKNGNLIFDENLLNEQQKPYRIYSAELRYKHDLGKFGSGQAGLKYGYSIVKNDFVNYENTAGSWLLNPEVGYDYQYSEKLSSVFYQYNLAKGKWTLTAGVRGEYTDGRVEGMGEAHERFDLFPSIYYDYKLNEHHNLGFSYTRRIRRISYFTLLPQRYYSSRYTVFEGNPDLKPNILDNVNFNYFIDRKYSFSVSYSHSNNALSRYNKTELIDNRSVLVSTYIDGVKEQNFNFNAYVPVKFANWWSSTNQANIYVNAYKTTENEHNNFNYDIFTQHDFSLPHGIHGQILYRYMSESKDAYSISYPYHLLNIAIRKSLLKDDNLNIKLEANRLIFNKSGQEIKTAQAFVQNYMYGKNPLFRLTLSYSFSSGKIKQVQSIQNSNEQEKGRTY